MPIDQRLIATATIHIEATPDEVWTALTDPETIRSYLFGAETITDWKVGSEILFQGDFDGQRWQDKGRILEIDQYSRLKYSYWSGFCGLEDLPENYGTVTYSLESSQNGTKLTVSQQGYVSDKSLENSQKGWTTIVAQIKSIVENRA